MQAPPWNLRDLRGEVPRASGRAWGLEAGAVPYDGVRGDLPGGVLEIAALSAERTAGLCGPPPVFKSPCRTSFVQLFAWPFVSLYSSLSPLLFPASPSTIRGLLA